MPARTGQGYIRGLQERPSEVWIGGERVADVTTHPALAGCAHSVAAVVKHPTEPPGRGTPEQHDAPRGAGDLRHDGTFA